MMLYNTFRSKINKDLVLLRGGFLVPCMRIAHGKLKRRNIYMR